MVNGFSPKAHHSFRMIPINLLKLVTEILYLQIYNKELFQKFFNIRDCCGGRKFCASNHEANSTPIAITFVSEEYDKKERKACDL